MAKRKRRARGQGGGGAAAGSEASGQGDGAAAASAGASRVRGGAFCVRSSLGVPFLVISDGQLVGGLPSPSPEDWRELLELSSGLVRQWESRGAALLADFEGEFTGFEGELVSAAFQRTWALDPKSLRPIAGGGPSKDMGLLVDLRSEEGVALVKRVMESEAMPKVIWGADGDVTSLRYTPLRKPLDICSARVVDAQLGFSSAQNRLAMNAMLKRLPPKSVAGLPAKDSIDFHTPHSRNQRALHLPLEPQEAAYAVDDLHRLDAILRTQKPQGGSFLPAERQTSAVVSLVMNSPAAASSAKLQQYQALMSSKFGMLRQVIAVRTRRHLMAVRRIAGRGCGADFAELERQADALLEAAGVAVPDDLSFCPGVPDGSQAAATAPVPAVEPAAAAKAPAAAGAAEAGAEGEEPEERRRKAARREAGAEPKKTGKRRAKKRKAAVVEPAEEASAEAAVVTAAASAVAAAVEADLPKGQGAAAAANGAKPAGTKKRRRKAAAAAAAEVAAAVEAAAPEGQRPVTAQPNGTKAAGAKRRKKKKRAGGAAKPGD